MKITLAIISHNAEKYIKRCLDSCINQTYKDIDIVVVDDNSSDGTVDIVKSYQHSDSRINLVVHSTNKSALQARKTVVKHAKSDYVWFLDSDDCIDNLGAVGMLSR
jgi:glycosyltransferase involved in cell wall biosynthesis